MSTYPYQSSTSYDSTAHGPAHPVSRQPYRQDSTSLPPIHVRSAQAAPFSSALLRGEQDTHGHFSNGATSTDHGGSFAPQQQSNYLAGQSLQHMGSAHSHMLSNMPGMSQGFGNYPAPASSGPQSQPALPSVTSMYTQPVGGNSFTGYPSSDVLSSQPQHYQQDNLKALDARMGRDLLGNDGQHSIAGSEMSTAVAGSLTGVKNADGKWACTLCQKTYQHQKHLKRHNLRHTGERPYRCHLCHETFCRSDILKRHFQKCSVRRGNPQGVTHLTHAQDHLKKPKADPVQHLINSSAHGVTTPSGLDSLHSRPTWFTQSPMYNNFGSGLPSSTGSTNTVNMCGSNGSSRSSSVPRPGSSGSASEDKKSHYSTSHTLPPMHAPDASPVDSASRFGYDAPYMRAGYNAQGPHANDQTNAFYGQTANGGTPQFAMQHGQPFSQSAQASQHYHNMTPVNGASNDNWLHDPQSAFHSTSQDGLMYQGSH